MAKCFSATGKYCMLIVITILSQLIILTVAVPQLPFYMADKLSVDQASIELASMDFGNIVKKIPSAVFHPSSVNDIKALIQVSYNSSQPFHIAARGQGHSLSGQAMTDHDGVVVNMRAMAKKAANGNSIKVFGSPYSGFHADVGGEQLWIDVLNATLENGLSPVSWTDYLYLTVGGTLSNAGISGQTFHYGPQISKVLEMDVVTGKGELVTCSPHQEPELFHGVLGGLGQFGIIARARIHLEPAPRRVRWIRMLYNDFPTFARDQEYLISSHGRNQKNALDFLEGLLLLHQGSPDNWRSSFFPPSDHSRIGSLVTQYGIIYCLEVAKYYDDSSQSTMYKELEDLFKGLDFIPGYIFEKDISYVEFLNRVRSGELKLQSQGLWDVPHPWLNLFVPKSRISDFDKGAFKGIVLRRNITTGPVLIYPMNRDKWDDRMSAVTPDEDVFYTVGFLHSGGFDDWKDFEDQNKDILEFCENAEIKVKQYLPHHKTIKEWKEHHASKWRKFQQRKNRFDPNMILSPGHGIFNN